ncbi:hypothetical protein HMPREF0578_0429 [Mobiluncus mulieris 28-1]|nr:hypothetical protein HMPREF0578_0429 [Mobiluncus mulieris 28-1]
MCVHDSLLPFTIHFHTPRVLCLDAGVPHLIWARKLGFWPGRCPSLRRESWQAPHEAVCLS